MAVYLLLELIRRALPAWADPDLLHPWADAALWGVDPQRACEQALRACPLLDWEAYSAHNPKVAAEGLDPVGHFLRDGLFESRKLYLRFCPARAKSAVSVIIICQGDAPALGRTLESVVNQTLKNIEIIVAFCCAAAESLMLIKGMADPRIKCLELADVGRHMAKKAAVAESSGAAVMFLDAGDSYLPTACEVAFGALGAGHDVVSFGANVAAPPAFMGGEEVGHLVKEANSTEFGEFSSLELMGGAYLAESLSRRLNTKIIASGLAHQAFSAMAETHCSECEDEYEILVIFSQAKSFLSIEDKVYTIQFPGSSLANSILPKLTSLKNIYVQIDDFIQSNNCCFCKSSCFNIIFDRLLSLLLSGDNRDDVVYFYSEIAPQIDIICFILRLFLYITTWKISVSSFSSRFAPPPPVFIQQWYKSKKR